MPSHTVSLKSILILSPYICLGLPSGLSLSGFTTNTLYAFLFYTMCATWPTHLIILDMIYLLICDNECKSWSSHYAVFFCLLLLPSSLRHKCFSATCSPTVSGFVCLLTF
jgi:hypothetical protein